MHRLLQWQRVSGSSDRTNLTRDQRSSITVLFHSPHRQSCSLLLWGDPWQELQQGAGLQQGQLQVLQVLQPCLHRSCLLPLQPTSGSWDRTRLRDGKRRRRNIVDTPLTRDLILACLDDYSRRFGSCSRGRSLWRQFRSCRG